MTNFPEGAFSATQYVAFEAVATCLSEQGYAVIDDFADIELVKALIELSDGYYEDGAFKKAGIGTSTDFHLNAKVRGDYIKWIDYKDAKEATRLYLDKVKALMHYLNRTCFLGLKDFESHYTRYPVGTAYSRHLDQFRQHDHRRLSFILYLNSDWKEEYGGNLLIYPNDRGEAISIAPLGGRFVCFRSDLLEHEVLTCYRERLSITGWMLDQLSELTFL